MSPILYLRVEEVSLEEKDEEGEEPYASTPPTAVANTAHMLVPWAIC